MKTATPRYCITASEGYALGPVTTYEVPVQRENLYKAFAHLAIDATDFESALREALEWTKRYNIKMDFGIGKRAFPLVRYGLSKDKKGLATRLFTGEQSGATYACVDTGWQPVGSLSL